MRNCYVTVILVFFLIVVAAVEVPAKDDSFRCGSDLIALGDTMYEVRSSCGEPYSSQIIGERNTYRMYKKERYKVESIYYLTEWIYEGNNGIYALTFEGSRLVRKEYIFN